ncbi:MAG: methylenetetrahydrofolate reductase [NAD(P)H] [Elusimicrobia bacterium]|nr:methylenetetrahydrofolate reductase [NAD(P)H] [Elusimicrobiota bacterium]
MISGSCVRVIEFYRRNEPVFSFEFFLPKTPQTKEAFRTMLEQVQGLKPHFVTLTYGAGGSAREATVEMAGVLKNRFGFETVMHLTCIAHTRIEIDQILQEARRLGIGSIMALRGDLPKDGSAIAVGQRDFKYARDLVEHLRRQNDWCIGVAGYPEGHPECPSKEEDLRHLKEKVEAGADYVVTQLFFDNRDYFDFVRRARAAGIHLPIVPGIMPIANFEQIRKFASMCGAKIPPALIERLSPVQNDPQAVASIGVEHATRQCLELLKGGAPGIHFYTLNKSQATQEILRRIKHAADKTSSDIRR